MAKQRGAAFRKTVHLGTFFLSPLKISYIHLCFHEMFGPERPGPKILLLPPSSLPSSPGMERMPTCKPDRAGVGESLFAAEGRRERN